MPQNDVGLTTLFQMVPCWLWMSPVSLMWLPVTMVEPLKSQFGMPKPEPEREQFMGIRENGLGSLKCQMFEVKMSVPW